MYILNKEIISLLKCLKSFLKLWGEIWGRHSWERSTHSASPVMLKTFQRITSEDKWQRHKWVWTREREKGSRRRAMWSDNRPDVYANRFDTPRVSPAGASEWEGGGRSAPLSPTAQQMSTFNPPLNGDGAEGSTAKWKWPPSHMGKGSTRSAAWRQSRAVSIGQT